MELPKHYDAHAAEAKWQKAWQEQGIYTFDPKSNKPVYSVDTPPPTVSGRMHLGHSFSYAQQDFIVRYHRMKGENVFYPFGTDDNGLPTDKLVEKTKKIRSKDLSREEYRKLALATVNELKEEFIADWIKLGMSCDFDVTYSTIDEHSQKTGQQSFLDLYKKGLVYREETPVVWCPSCQTAIAQAEFDNVEMKSHFNDILFTSQGKELVIATTRPELLAACVALAAHPDDDRYKGLKGKFATVPIFEHEVPIIFDAAVEMEKGTGLMMICTFGDKEDVEKWHAHKLPLRIIFTENGRLNELAPGYEGLRIQEARKKILEDLAQKKLLVAQKEILHAVNVHERCNTPIEFLKKPQWFVKLLDHKEELLELGKKINWYPEHMRTRYEHWVQNLNYDWCISRQRFYGVPFPVWYTKEGEIVVAKQNELPIDPTASQPEGHADLLPETDVMDTWNISSCSPQIALNWVKEQNEMNLFPMSLRPQAHDIIRTWAFYTIAKGLYHQKQQPWKDIVISGHVLDPQGRKMSKSKGNVIAPQDVMEKYSADALRFWAAGVKLGEDLPYMEKDLQTGQKTMTKLWNATKFAIMHLEEYAGFDGEPALLDRWLLTKFHRLVKEVTEHFNQYEYMKTRLGTDKFFWQTLCDNYLEFAKDRLYNPDQYGEATLSARHALYVVTLGVLKLFAPVMPHLTEELYHLYYKQHEKAASIHLAAWPAFDEGMVDEAAEAAGDQFAEIVATVRKHKSDNKLSMKAPLKKLTITTTLDLHPVQQELAAVTGAEEVLLEEGDFSINIA